MLLLINKETKNKGIPSLFKVGIPFVFSALLLLINSCCFQTSQNQQKILSPHKFQCISDMNSKELNINMQNFTVSIKDLRYVHELVFVLQNIFIFKGGRTPIFSNKKQFVERIYNEFFFIKSIISC